MSDTSEPNPVGRPTLYKPEYCELLIAHMTEGLTFESFGAVVDVSKQTLYDWVAAHSEFLDAKERGTSKSLLHWEKLGLDHIINLSESFGNNQGSKSTSLNASVWIINMKNRFGWRDKQPGEEDKVTVNNYASKSDEDIDARLAELEQKLKETEGKP